MQQQLDPTKSILFSEDSTGAGGVSNPTNDLALHKKSTDVHAFTSLSDAPKAYTGEEGKFVRVKTTADGLEFAAASSGSGSFDYGLITEDAGASQDWGTI